MKWLWMSEEVKVININDFTANGQDHLVVDFSSLIMKLSKIWALLTLKPAITNKDISVKGNSRL
jgi:hypothetical protein